jgi:hypothetical protein
MTKPHKYTVFRPYLLVFWEVVLWLSVWGLFTTCQRNVVSTSSKLSSQSRPQFLCYTSINLVSYTTGKTRLRGGKVLTRKGGTYIIGVTTETNVLECMNVILLHNMHRNVSSISLYNLYQPSPTWIMIHYIYRLRTAFHTSILHPEKKILSYILGARGGVVVKALRYKPEDRGFESRWCHWNFSVT